MCSSKETASRNLLLTLRQSHGWKFAHLECPENPSDGLEFLSGSDTSSRLIKDVGLFLESEEAYKDAGRGFARGKRPSRYLMLTRRTNFGLVLQSLAWWGLVALEQTVLLTYSL